MKSVFLREDFPSFPETTKIVEIMPFWKQIFAALLSQALSTTFVKICL
jgi:hypothetical protein